MERDVEGVNGRHERDGEEDEGRGERDGCGEWR